MDFASILALTQKTYKNIEAKLLSDANPHEGTLYRRSGCFAFDWVLANHNAGGGLPRGRIIEIFGPENSGKTTLCTVCSASVNRYKDRNSVLFIDFEHKWDMRYGLALGIRKDRFWFCQPSGPLSGVGGLQLMVDAIDAEDIGLIIVDSLPAVMSKEEEEGELTDANIGAQARLWGKALKKVSNSSNPCTPTLMITNQLRDNIGALFGPKEKTAGGRAVKFYATCRVDIRAKEKQAEDEDDSDSSIFGQNVQIKVIKNQAGENFQSTETQIIFGEGYNNEQWVLDKAIELGIVKEVRKKKPRILLWPEYEDTKIQEPVMLELLEQKYLIEKLYTQCVNVKQKITKEQEDAAAEARRLKEAKSLSPAPASIELSSTVEAPDF